MVKAYLSMAIFPIIILRAQNIEIITTTPYNFSIDIVSTTAAFEIAAENAMEIYGGRFNITIKYLLNKSHRNCDDVASQNAQMLAEYYYTSHKEAKCYAIVSVACGDQTGIASLARGFDWLLFTNAVSKNDFLNKTIGSPTAIALTGTYLGYAKVVLEVLSFYAWYHATLLVEAKALSLFYQELANQLLQSAKVPNDAFVLEKYLLDVTSNETINTALRFAKQRSRVFILLTTGSTAARILGMADQEGLTNGEYVFFNVQPSQADGYGKESQFSYPFNDANLMAFRALIFISYLPSNDKLKELNLAIARKSKALFNGAYKNGNQPLDLPPIQSSYDIVDLFATLVNESHDNGNEKASCSGLDLAKRMSNRTFNLFTGPAYVSSTRTRNFDLVVFAFNTSTMALQPIGTYKWSEDRLIWNKRRIDWPTVENRPPRDIPLCGFSGRDGECVEKALFSIINPVIASVVSGLLLFGLTFLLRHYMDRSLDKWWHIAYDDLYTNLRFASSHRNLMIRHAHGFGQQPNPFIDMAMVRERYNTRANNY